MAVSGEFEMFTALLNLCEIGVYKEMLILNNAFITSWYICFIK